MRPPKHILLIDPRDAIFSDVLAYAVRHWGFRLTRIRQIKGFRIARLEFPLDGIFVVTCGPMTAKETGKTARLARRCGGVPWMAWNCLEPRSPAEIHEDLRNLTMRKRGPKPYAALKEATR